MALDGKTGATMWDYYDDDIGDHHPAEIADLDGDGVNDAVILSAQIPVVLHANNGTVWWNTSATLSYQNYIANFDVDGDGYKEVFTTSGMAFNSSYDFLATLSHDGLSGLRRRLGTRVSAA